MNRRVIYTIGIAVILFFLFFNPFKRNKEQDVQRPYVSSDTKTMLTDFITGDYTTPEELLVGMFDRHDIVFLGEVSQIKQQVELVSNVIPALYSAGVRHLGVELALHEDQADIDSIVTAASYDEQAVEQVLFNRMVIWGYQEYADIFKAAWKLNSGLPTGAEPFRIVGLNVRQNWEFIETERDLKKPEIVAQVFSNGIPEVVMAETIIDEFVRKNHKALIFVGMPRAFTDFETIHYTETAEDTGLSDTRRTGNIVHDEIGSRAATVMMHGPWPYQRAQLLAVFPANGVFDAVMEELPAQMQNAGLQVTGTELADLAVGRSDYAYKYNNLTLGQLCDGYIIMGPIAEYQVVTAIPGFITPDNLDEAIRNFPGPTVVDEIDDVALNEYIAGLLANRLKYLEKFK